MRSFWDRSWEQIDGNRITQYVSLGDSRPDPILEYLLARDVKTVCDAGCGCGMFTRKLAFHGFTVSGFDIAPQAVKIAGELVKDAPARAELKTASVLDTGYPADWFDCVISRSVLDHMPKADGVAAVRELYRITKPGGLLLLTLDDTDGEYESEAHTVNADGDYLFTGGKWDGMVFHPYREPEIAQMIPPGAVCRVKHGEDETIVLLEKPVPSAAEGCRIR